jgi:hypothetical protein
MIIVRDSHFCACFDTKAIEDAFGGTVNRFRKILQSFRVGTPAAS